MQTPMNIATRIFPLQNNILLSLLHRKNLEVEVG